MHVSKLSRFTQLVNRGSAIPKTESGQNTMTNQEIKSCQNCKTQFDITTEDLSFYSKIQVPPPTFCPDCRLERRMSFRNERSLYKDTCDLCKKQMVSMYSPDSPRSNSGGAGKPFTVYCKECWYSDNWDPLQYGQEYDWNKPFFAQFRELMEKVPRIGIMHIRNNINCDYGNYIFNSKNVYLSQSVSENSENVYYSRTVDKSKDIFDCFTIKESEQCYENIDGARNYSSKFMVRSRNCIESAFLFDCVNCQNCFMSSNLRNKRFIIRNKQYTKESYAEEIKKISVGKHSSIEALKKEFMERMKKALHKFGNLIKVANCTGNNIDNSKNTFYSFDIYDNEDTKYCVRVIKSSDAYDVMGAGSGELIYEALAGGYDSYKSKFFSHGDITDESYFTDWCQSSEHLFGCVSVRKKQYCILNKQYTKEEYEKLVPKIIEHMNSMPFADKKGRIYKYGEFFPTEISPFAYNETIAQEYFPLTKEEALERGYAWRDPDPSPYKPTLEAHNLPDDIASTTDSITNEIIQCAECGKVYRILKPELDFLKQHTIALPRACPECRHKKRFNLRNPLKLWHRRCVCLSAVASTKADDYRNTARHFHGDSPCPNEFETSYAPDRPETIYCEQCYQAEVI